MRKLGIPFIISAPSGAGKTSLVHALQKVVPNLLVSVSHTTREIRPGEKNGVNYHFISEAQFQDLIAKNEFIEYAKVFDHYYGTTRTWLETQLEKGNDVILEIDWQGAAQIRKKVPDAISIFILPPSLNILSQRLQNRGQDNAVIIEKRMLEARAEISHFDEFDFIVINDNFDTAVNDLQAIVQSQHLRIRYQKQQLSHLLANLLS